MKRNIRILIFTFSPFLFSACYPEKLLTLDAGLGSALGAGAGVAIGKEISDTMGDEDENMAIGGIIGAGSGLLAGSLVNRARTEPSIEPRVVTVRTPMPASPEQKLIDHTRTQMELNSQWGQQETKPWNERYAGDNYDLPYEGDYSDWQGKKAPR